MEIRLGVGVPYGLCSAIWRFWTTKKSDVYFSPRNLAATIKFSLHASGHCVAAFTSPFQDHLGGESKMPGGNRRFDAWWRVVGARSGVSAPCQVVFPKQELRVRQQPDLARNVQWLAPPPPDHALHVCPVFSAMEVNDDDWPGKENGFLLIQRAALRNGETLWLVAFTQPVSPQLQQAILHARHQMQQPDWHWGDLSSPDGRMVSCIAETNGGRVVLDLARPPS